MQKLEVSVRIQLATRAIDAIASSCELPRGRIKDAMTKGAVWLTREGKQRRIRRATADLRPDDTITLYYDEQILSASPPQPDCLLRRRSYSCWYKPAGLMSSGSRFGDHHAIDRYVAKVHDSSTFLVHRLDLHTRGVMVIAESRRSAAALSGQFQSRGTTKRYEAIVNGQISSPFSVTTDIDGKDAISHIEPRQQEDGRTLVMVTIETGRKHQIRRHLAEAGYPVVGDRLYGGDSANELQLLAAELAFDCPESGDRIEVTAPDQHRLTLSAPA